jgi:hypothetical protein
MLNDDPELPEPEFVDFAAYGKVIPIGLERPSRDIDEPCLWTLTDDTARFLNDKRSQAAYDEYLHIGCNVDFDSCPNAGTSEGLDALSPSPPLSTHHNAAVALIRAGHSTHAADGEGRPYSIGLPSPHQVRPRIRADCSPSSPTSVSTTQALPRSLAHWMSYAKRS